MLSNIVIFLTNHQAVISALVIATIDFLYAVNKNLQSNGILHSIYLFFQSKKELPLDQK